MFLKGEVIELKAILLVGLLFAVTFAGCIGNANAVTKEAVHLDSYVTSNSGRYSWTSFEVYYLPEQDVTCISVPDRWTLSCLPGKLGTDQNVQPGE